MIQQLTQIAKIEGLLSSLKTARFNALLPMGINVMEKKGANQYTLMVGNKEIQTKSMLELEVGGKYWGVMKENVKSGSITLSNLLKKPELLQKQTTSFLPTFTENKLSEILSKDNPKAELKMVLLEQLSRASSKSEFMTLTNMVAALNENVFSLVLANEGQKTLFQFKKRKSKNSAKHSQDMHMMDFYAAFENLGPVEGVVEVVGDEKRLSLYLYYENSYTFLQKELENLNFEGVIYHKEGIIEPLFEMPSGLLDIKG